MCNFVNIGVYVALFFVLSTIKYDLSHFSALTCHFCPIFPGKYFMLTFR